MTHISTKQLSDKMERALRERLVDMLRIIGRDRNLKHALNELLTYTETTMLAKRIGIIYMIHNDIPVLQICDTLNVSSSTVLRMWKLYDRGAYKNLEKSLAKLEPSLVEIIEIFLRAGLPPIVGKGRIKHIVGDQ